MLEHTHNTEDLVRRGDLAGAVRAHNARVTAELERARQGATIDLSDLMAAREVLEVPALVRRAR